MEGSHLIRKVLPFAILLMRFLFIFIIPSEPEDLKLVFKAADTALTTT